MSSLIAPRNAIEHPVRTLVILWAIYKAIILLIAIPTPGPGYDTSTHLYEHQISKDAETCGWLACFLTTISKNLTRWDALYFTRVARKGYEVEQYWAFGWGWTQLIHYFSSDLRASSLGNYAFVESFVGIVIAHVAHLLSVLSLHKLTKEIFTGPSGKRLAFVCAALHIVAPGGVFLSAPYGESTTSLLCFLGMIFLVKSFPLFGTSSFMHDLSILIAGIIFGLATMVRSNAMLYGALLLEEALRVVWSSKDGITYQKTRRGVFTGLGGICIAIGFAYPQWIAYNQFCYPDPTARPWCQKPIPSIYTFVQKRYWDVGFLRYWTVNHIPLFTLAAPMLTILLLSARWTFGLRPAEHTKPSHEVDHYRTTDKEKAMATRTVRILQSLAYPQVFLGVMAIFCYHVQIITRIGSAYPLGYFWIGTSVIEWSKRKKAQARVRVRLEGRGKKVKTSFGEWWMEEWPMVAVCYCVMYGLIQAVLFASFLPPA